MGHVDNSSYPQVTVNIPLTLTVPAHAKGPVPVMMEFSFDPELMAELAKACILPPPPTGPTWQEQVLAKGSGYAVLDSDEVQADNGEGLTQGIIGLVNQGQPRKPDDWGRCVRGHGVRAGRWIILRRTNR